MISYFNIEEVGTMPKERLELALQFLKNIDHNSLQIGEKILIDGDNVIAEVHEYETLAEQTLPFETHDIYADIHYIVSGAEMFGIAKREALVERGEYNSSKDVTFYDRPGKYVSLPLTPGTCVLATPNEGHMPKAQMDEPCTVRKIVIKIKMT